MTDPLNIVIAGVGGQGNILASQLLGAACVRDGLYVNIGETYGASQRGGCVTSQVRISARREYGPLIPSNQAHVVIGFEPVETLRVLPQLANPRTTVISNDRPLYPLSVLSGQANYPAVGEVFEEMRTLVGQAHRIAATELAAKAGNAKATNIVMLGALVGAGLAPVSAETALDVFREKFAGQNLETNRRAFRLGMEEMKMRRDAPQS